MKSKEKEKSPADKAGPGACSGFSPIYCPHAEGIARLESCGAELQALGKARLPALPKSFS